jgi:hypothetical protein
MEARGIAAGSGGGADGARTECVLMLFKVFLTLAVTSMSVAAAFAQAFLPFYIANIKS